MSSDARYVTTEETPATATANPDRQAGQDIARPRARSAASAISFPGLAYGEVAIARPALVGKVDTGTDPSVRARSDTRSTQPVSSLTAGTAGEEARDALADSAMWGLLRRTADAVSRVGQAAMAGVVGTRADATMEGLAKGLDCLTPTRSVIIYLGLIFVLTATALVRGPIQGASRPRGPRAPPACSHEARAPRLERRCPRCTVGGTWKQLTRPCLPQRRGCSSSSSPWSGA